MPAAPRIAAATVGAAAVLTGYGSLVERNAFTLRRTDVPVLAPGTAPIRVLHISDLHITARQRRKQEWVRRLAGLSPDLVVNTGDTISDPLAIPAIMSTLDPLLAFPGVFVPGNNDYYAPRLKNPLRYFVPQRHQPRGAPLPWAALVTALTSAGWLDLTHVRAEIATAAGTIAIAGTDDPHLHLAHYELIAGKADPTAAVRIGVTHSPEPAMLECFADDGYDLVLAGHTHGGQIRIPFGPAIVTNCGIDVHRARWLHRWDERMWFHISAGVGTNPFAPVRLACPPEANLLTLVPRP